MITWECVNYSWLRLFPWATQVIVLAKHKRVCNMLIHLIIFNTYSIWPWIEVEQTSKNRNSNIPNFRGLNFEHIQTSHLNPKLTSQTSLNTELFANFINNSSKILKTEPWTCPNIWFWPKTELQTSRISPKTKHFANIKLFVPPLALTLPLPVLWARKSAPNGVLWIRKKRFIVPIQRLSSILHQCVRLKAVFFEILWIGQPFGEHQNDA